MGSLGRTLRTLREDAHLTQEELAERSGLSARTISDIERGLRRRLYPDTAGRLAGALGLAGSASDEFSVLARGQAVEAPGELDLGYRHRFVTVHLERVEQVGRELGREDHWYAALDADAANVEVALRWAHEDGDAESVLRLSLGLWQYWQARGELARGRAWLERGLAGAVAPPSTRLKALWALAWLAFEQGDDAYARECARLLSEAAAGTGDDTARRNAATVRGMVSLAGGDASGALRELTEALSYAERLDQPWLVATSHLNLGLALVASNDPSTARASFNEALRRYEELGDERFRARCLGYLGLSALAEDQHGRAQSLYSQSLAAFVSLAEPKGTAEGLAGLAAVAATNGDPVRAATLGAAAERLRESYSGRALPLDARLVEARLEGVRSQTTVEAWASAWTRGRALRLEEAVTLALGE